MDDRKLDTLEQALLMHASGRVPQPVPNDFTARIMREVRNRPARGADFLDVFSLVARRFAPVGALAATALCGYAQFFDRVLSQALLSVSMHSASVTTLAGLMP